MNKKLSRLALCALAGLLCSCVSSQVIKTTKTPDCQPPSGKIAVLAMDDRELVRQGFENRFVRQLAQAGDPAAPTFDLLTLPQIKQNKQAAADRLRAEGMAAVLIIRLANVAGSNRDVQLDGDRTAVTLNEAGAMGWHDYYTADFNSATYGNLKQSVYLETGLYDLKTGKRFWFGLTRTVVTEDMDRAAETDSLVEKIVVAMQKDGAIR